MTHPAAPSLVVATVAVWCALVASCDGKVESPSASARTVSLQAGFTRHVVERARVRIPTARIAVDPSAPLRLTVTPPHGFSVTANLGTLWNDCADTPFACDAPVDRFVSTLAVTLESSPSQPRVHLDRTDASGP